MDYCRDARFSCRTCSMQQGLVPLQYSLYPLIVVSRASLSRLGAPVKMSKIYSVSFRTRAKMKEPESLTAISLGRSSFRTLSSSSSCFCDKVWNSENFVSASLPEKLLMSGKSPADKLCFLRIDLNTFGRSLKKTNTKR